MASYVVTYACVRMMPLVLLIMALYLRVEVDAVGGTTGVRLPSSGGPRSLSFAEDTHPPILSWQTLVQHIKEAGCTDEYERPTHARRGETAFWPLHALLTAAPNMRRPLPDICLRPIALMFWSSSNCSSCQSLFHELLNVYPAEFRLLRRYVTFVDGGEGAWQTVLRRPFPHAPWFGPKAAREVMQLLWPPGLEQGNAELAGGDVDGSPTVRPPRAIRISAWKKYAIQAGPAIREDTMPREVRNLVRNALFFRSRRWERAARLAYAGQSDYYMRVIFLYPHNGSVMRDVINEDPVSGVSNNLHFYYTALPLFESAYRALRVIAMEGLR